MKIVIERYGHYMVAKTCHPCVGVVAWGFAEDTTQRYSSVSITELLHLDLKWSQKERVLQELAKM